MFRFVMPIEVAPLGDDEVQVTMSTAIRARDGHILVPQGCQLQNYQRNPIVLFQHLPEEPIGNAQDIAIGQSSITARIRFAPVGISRRADEVRGLMKAGVLRAVSVGFDPIEMEPLDPTKPRAGQRISKWDLLELSAVSVGADTNALVTARALSERAGKVLSSANAAALQDAHDHAEQCRAVIANVMSGNPDGDSEDQAKRQRQAQRRRLAEVYGMADPPGVIGTNLTRDQRMREVELLGVAP